MVYSIHLTSYHPGHLEKQTTATETSVGALILRIQLFCEIDPQKNVWDGKLVTAMVLGGCHGYSHFELKRNDGVRFTARITPSFYDLVLEKGFFLPKDLPSEGSVDYTYWSKEGIADETRTLDHRVLLLPHRIQALALCHAESFHSASSSFQISPSFSEFPKKEINKTEKQQIN